MFSSENAQELNCIHYYRFSDSSKTKINYIVIEGTHFYTNYNFLYTN